MAETIACPASSLIEKSQCSSTGVWPIPMIATWRIISSKQNDFLGLFSMAIQIRIYQDGMHRKSSMAWLNKIGWSTVTAWLASGIMTCFAP
jgi:hypothetical protein